MTQGERYPSNEVADESVGAAEIAKLPTVEEKDHDNLLYVVDIIQQEANRVNEDKKRIFRSEIMDELEIIQKKLHKLLAENDNVVDIEKLERDDFVVDVERQEQFVADGEHVCNLIRKDAEKETLKLKLLHEIVKKNTWDTMEVQSKACKSILNDQLLWNFSLRSLRPEEKRIYKQIELQRKIELMSRAQRLEKQVKEALDECEFSQEIKKHHDKEKNIYIPLEVKEEYFMNRLRGKPNFIDDDAIKKVQEAID